MTQRFALSVACALALLAPTRTRALETAPSPDSIDAPANHDERQVEVLPVAAPDPAEKKRLDEWLRALDGVTIAEDEKKQAVEFYQQALHSFDAALQQVESARGFEQQLLDSQTGDDSTAEYAQLLAKPLPTFDDVAALSLEDLEQRAAKTETSLARCREELAAMIAEPKRRSQRTAEIPAQAAEAQQRLKQAADALASLGPEETASAVAVARRAALTWCCTECSAILYALDREQRFYDHTGEWIAARRDYYARSAPHKEKRLAQLRDMINQRRAAEAAERARTAAAAAADPDRPRAIRELADDNKMLADDGAELTAQMTETTADLDSVRDELATLGPKYKSALEQAGQLSPLGGQLLREQQAKLPDARALRRAASRRETLLADALLRTYDLSDQRSALADLDEATAAVVARIKSVPVTDAMRTDIRQLLAAQRNSLDRLIEDYGKFSAKLNELHGEEAKLIELSEDYAEFIAERVLWIRSCSPPALADWSHAVRGVQWSITPRLWRKAGVAMQGVHANQPALCAAFVLGLIALAVMHAPARRRLSELGDEARKPACTSLQSTLHAIAATVVAALPWPALLAFLGWSLDSLAFSEFVHALGVALRFSAACLLVLELARTLCRRGGLAEAHFNWPSACLAQVRGKLHWLELVGMPLTFWLICLDTQQIETRWSSSLGRGLFVALMTLLCVAFERLLLARESPFRQLVVIRRGGWLAPLQALWRPVVVALPAALAVLALSGYYYTALQAALRILQSGAIVLAVLVLGGVTRRWLLVNHRRLAREQAKLRRAQLAAQRASEPGDDPHALPTADLVDDVVDLAALSEKTQKLVHVFLSVTTAAGLVLIWRHVLPALEYPAKQLLPGAETLTWGALFAFLFILAVTYVTVRDVPALIELVILRHLPLDSGSRYAFAAVSRYLFSAIGVTAAFRAIGVNWNQIQWLVAAMSVGLGFGLQEIFGNFVSGIILLFERPIRVGDMVTLGDKSGVVSRIRMRATTIVDGDRKEYIVPNKDLVTERLLNWTLSDQTNRVEVIVNIANGSDTDLACSLLLDSAHEQPHVLREPSPSAAFEGFTDNGLKLALRCFLPNLEHRTATIHGLHTSIDRKFHAASIDGAYGDLRIRVSREMGRAVQATPHVALDPSAVGPKRRADAKRQGAA